MDITVQLAAASWKVLQKKFASDEAVRECPVPVRVVPQVRLFCSHYQVNVPKFAYAYGGDVTQVLVKLFGCARRSWLRIVHMVDLSFLFNDTKNEPCIWDYDVAQRAITVMQREGDLSRVESPCHPRYVCVLKSRSGEGEILWSMSRNEAYVSIMSPDPLFVATQLAGLRTLLFFSDWRHHSLDRHNDQVPRVW
jgi:hypothetical protein